MSTQPSAQSCPALEKLERGSQYKIVLLIAPNGSGKSGLIQHWMRHSSTFQTNKPLCLRLETEDNQANKFISKLARELKKWNASIENHDCAQIDLEAKSASSEELHPMIENLLNDFLNSIMRLAGHRILIMLNYDVIEDLSIHKMVSHLLDYLPPNLHLVIASQDVPPLQIARLRARRELLEIHPEDLKFHSTGSSGLQDSSTKLSN